MNWQWEHLEPKDWLGDYCVIKASNENARASAAAVMMKRGSGSDRKTIRI